MEVETASSSVERKYPLSRVAKFPKPTTPYASELCEAATCYVALPGPDAMDQRIACYGGGNGETSATIKRMTGERIVSNNTVKTPKATAATLQAIVADHKQNRINDHAAMELCSRRVIGTALTVE